MDIKKDENLTPPPTQNLPNGEGRVELNCNSLLENEERSPTACSRKTPTQTEENALQEKKKSGKTWLGILYILLAALFFSLMSLFVRLSGDLPVFQKSFFRNLVAAIVSFLLLAKSGDLKMKKGSLPALLGRSIAGTIGILCNFYAIDNMPLADASILNKLSPFFSIIFSAILLKEKSGIFDWFVVALAFIGAVFVAKPGFAGFTLSQSVPALLGVIGGLGAGLAYTFVRYLGGKGERTGFIVFFFSTFSCLCSLPLMLASYAPMSPLQLVYLLLAGCSAAAAQFSITAAYKHAPAKDISVYDYSQVLFTALFAGFIFGELPDLWSFLGYAVIIAAALIKYFHAHKTPQKPKASKKENVRNEKREL